VEKYRGYLLLSLVYTAILGATLLWRQPAPAPIRIIEATPRPSPTPARLVVHVAGAVARPGVYTLAEGSRVNDAIEAAGGLTSRADEAALNLAAPLRDGQRLSIPAVGEAPSPGGIAGVAEPAATPPAGEPGALININTASAAELDALPGIGAVLAQRIIDDRQANGPYASVDDLERVRGIGPALLASLRPLVTVR
jgi:competence protein ComEA